MSFYRKYRPQTIAEVDNVKIRETLISLAAKPRPDFPHAYLLVGPRGAGKTTTARLIAKLLNCEKPGSGGVPCGKCEQCLGVARGTSLDVLEMDAASNRGIEEIRAIRDGVGLSPTRGKYKVYIIDEVHMLTTEAFNALLKTLEEPPAHAVFVLATTDPQKLPVTVKSRCLILNFGLAEIDILVQSLTKICQAEKLQVDPAAITAIAEAGEGSFRDAIKILEQLSMKGGKISLGDVTGELQGGDSGLVRKFCLSLGKGETKSALGIISELKTAGIDSKNFLIQFMKLLAEALVESASEVGNKYEISDYPALLRMCERAYLELKNTPLPYLPLEILVVEYTQTARLDLPHPPKLETAKTEKAAIDTVVSSQEHSVIASSTDDTDDLLDLTKLTGHWPDLIGEVKNTNNSLAGILRSARPKEVKHGIVTIEAFYTFHKDKLADIKAREILTVALKKLFGVRAKVEIVLGKK